jgi:hypothetical protein
VEVTLHNLRHAYPADLDILLVSPSGAKIMLMSDAGGPYGVTNATLVFHPSWMSHPYPPTLSPIASDSETHFSASNEGEIENSLPGAPAGPYLGTLDALVASDYNPNGIWFLYIYDDASGRTGILQESWSITFNY